MVVLFRLIPVVLVIEVLVLDGDGIRAVVDSVDS